MRFWWVNHKQTFRHEFGWRVDVDFQRFLVPSIDHLFDRGFITFADDGELVISPIADCQSLQRMGVPTEEIRGVGAFNADQKHFLDYHRNEIFLQSAS